LIAGTICRKPAISTSERKHPLIGVMLMLAALFCFAVLDTTGKYLSQRYPVGVLVWARYLVPALVLAAALYPRMGRDLVVTGRWRLQIVRAALLAGVSFLIMGGLRTIPMAEGTSLFFITPLIVTLLAGPVLGERVTPAHWLLALFGFSGVLLIARPDGDLPLGPVLMLLAGSLLYALYQLATRKLAPTERPLTTLFYTALIGAGLSSVACRQLRTATCRLGDTLLVLSLGVSGMAGHFLLIRAMAFAPASTLSPLIYVQLVWATLMGWAVFGDLPGASAIGGAAIIVVSGLLSAWLAHRR
jgi:drug/metabolite transporter (DMT)-like permease